MQGIDDDFAVRVHEESAFFAIQHRDYIQFNECLTRLVEFYKTQKSPRKIHFLSCRLLQFAFDGNSSELLQMLQELTHDQMAHSEVRLCLSIIDAINMANTEFILGLIVSCTSEYVKAIVRMFATIVRTTALVVMAETLGD